MSCYNFDLFNMTGCNYLAHFDTNDELLSRLRNDKTFLRDIRKCFTGWVDRVLERRCASKMNALRVSFVLGKESAFHINRWIKYAANQGLTQLELDFELFYVDYSCSIANEFPFQFFGSLNYLRLNFCNFSYPPDFKGFNSLVSLTLFECFLTKDCLQNMLSNCSSLQHLSLRYCKFHGFLRKLKFSGSSLPLKHLLLHMTIPDEIMKIKVHDINLISLEFHGCNTKLSIKNTPRLARLVLRTETPVDIQSNIPCLETLFFSASFWVKEIVLPKFHVFSNLKRLVFSANIVTAICLLRACPLLQKLELYMSNLGPVLTENLTHETPHNNLKKLGIYGFQDHPEKIEVIKYLLRNAVVLEKMKIFLITKTYVGNGEWILREGTVKHTEMSMEKVSQLLQNEMRPSTKLIFRPHK